MKVLLMTVGTGRNREDIASALHDCIRQINPGSILFLCSEKSREETVPLILKKLGEDCPEYTIIPSAADAINDAERLYLAYWNIVNGLLAKGIEGRDLVFDFTSGTKPMSAALVACAFVLENGTLSYIHGDRDDTGRVATGTERFSQFRPVELTQQRAFNVAADLFNNYHFSAAVRLLNEAVRRGGKPETLRRLHLLKSLSEGYYQVELFELGKAHEIFLQVREDKALLQDFGIHEAFGRNLNLLKAVASPVVQKRESDKRDLLYCPERLALLYANALRRGEEGRYEDAVARLYRATEFLGQLVLYREKKQETKKFPLDGLPADLRDRKKADKDGCVSLGLRDTFRLLESWEHSLGKRFMELWKEGLEGRLNDRNNGILAHGFEPCSREGFEALLACFDQLVPLCEKDWVRLAGFARFPKIAV